MSAEITERGAVGALKTFMYRYRWNSREFGFEIPAYSREEADARLAALKAWSHYDGELAYRIPASVGFWVPLWCWFRNLWVRS